MTNGRTMMGIRAGVGLLGLSMVLASCGGVAPDGSGSLRISALTTEYRTSTGTYVACDNVDAGKPTATNITNVAVSFSLAGEISSVDVGLRGSTTDKYDSYYTASISGNALSKLGGSDFKTVFKANSIDSQYLPQSIRPLGIIVNPVAVTIKIVNPANRISDPVTGPGSFFAVVSATTSTGAKATGNSILVNSIPVYSQCTILSNTGEKL